MDQPPEERKRNRWLTKRMFYSVTGLVTASVALWQGKLDGENWVFALAVIIAGHHGEDLVRAWRK